MVSHNLQWLNGVYATQGFNKFIDIHGHTCIVTYVAKQEKVNVPVTSVKLCSHAIYPYS